MNNKKKILIVNDEMVVGGVARVLNNMLKDINDLDCQIDILILHPQGEMLKDIPDNYHILDSTPFFETCDLSLGDAIKKESTTTLFKKLWFFFLMKTGLIHKYIKREREKIIKEKYDVEIAYKEGFCTIFVADGDSKKKVNWVHVDYEKNNYSKHHMNLVKNSLDKIDVHVAQSYDAAKAYKNVFGINKEFLIINNFIDEEDINKRKNEECHFDANEFNIVSVGRLHPQKAYLRMMEVCRRLNEDNLKYDLYILGDGEERLEIEKKIKDYHLDNVHLLGYNSNPYKYMKNADLYLMCSIYESAPTVVYEALAVGQVPILACEVAGIHEQLGNNEYGIVVENSEDGLYEKIKEILNDKEMLNKYRSIKKDISNNQISKEKIKDLFLND